MTDLPKWPTHYMQSGCGVIIYHHYHHHHVSVYCAPGHVVNANEFICDIYWPTFPNDAHQVLVAYGIHLAF